MRAEVLSFLADVQGAQSLAELALCAVPATWPEEVARPARRAIEGRRVELERERRAMAQMRMEE